MKRLVRLIVLEISRRLLAVLSKEKEHVHGYTRLAIPLGASFVLIQEVVVEYRKVYLNTVRMGAPKFLELLEMITPVIV